jgi:hypothetical protein
MTDKRTSKRPLPRPSSAERAERRTEIIRATRAGESQRAIAARLGISRALVQKELRAVAQQPAQEATSAYEAASLALTPTTTPAKPRATGSRAAAVVVKQQGDGITGTWAAGFASILPPPDHLSAWRKLDLDRDTFSKATPHQLMSILMSISPDTSRAVWDWLRLLNSGHEIIALKPGTDDQDDRAQLVLDEFITRLERHHGSFKAISDRLFMGALSRGAFFAELVLDQRKRLPLDIVTPDPAIVRFRLRDLPERGPAWIPGQWQDGRFVTFDVPNVIYIPLDPEPGDPYGRPMLAPAVFTSIFLLGVLHDLRRVIAQQGYPRTDIIINLEKLRDAFRTLDDAEFEEKVDELIRTVERSYARLEPDDAYVHTDPIEVNRAPGAVDTSVMGGANAMIEGLERMATRALKSMPLLMGITDGVSEANANRQWEIHAAGVKTVQHYAETLLGRLLSLALQVQGVVATVRVRYAEVRAAEELRDAQTFLLKLKSAELAERLGYVTADEAAEYATGHGIPEEILAERVPLLNQPARIGTGTGAGVVETSGAGGNERRRMSRAIQRGITKTRIPGAEIVRHNPVARHADGGVA